ncbi:MAG TPA: hypothetical protein VGM37_10725 [Armatimonadota bacterium]|jgi:hypothetical protein
MMPMLDTLAFVTLCFLPIIMQAVTAVIAFMTLILIAPGQLPRRAWREMGFGVASLAFVTLGWQLPRFLPHNLPPIVHDIAWCGAWLLSWVALAFVVGSRRVDIWVRWLAGFGIVGYSLAALLVIVYRKAIFGL